VNRVNPSLNCPGLALYAIGSLLFGCLVLVFLCRFLPSRILALPSQARRLVEAGFTNGAEGNVPGALAVLVHLLCLCLMLAGAARMLARAVAAGMKAGRKVLCRLKTLYEPRERTRRWTANMSEGNSLSTVSCRRFFS